MTSRYVAKPDRCRALAGLMPIARIKSGLLKLAEYSHPGVTGCEWVVRPSATQRLAYRALGSRVNMRRESIDDAVVRRCTETGSAGHSFASQARSVFRRLKPTGLPLILEQVTGHRAVARELLLHEHSIMGVPMPATSSFDQSAVDYNEEELQLADWIVVGSDFVAQTLAMRGYRSDRIVLAEYGVNAERFHVRHPAVRSPRTRLEVAFIGSDAIRKGLLYLLKAIRSLGPAVAHLHYFGSPGAIGSKLAREYSDLVTVHGPVSQSELIRAAGTLHVSVLPSLWEGSSYAVAESMAMGLPVIVTPNTGSFARSGVDGFVVPVRDSAAIASALQSLFDDEPLRQSMGASAAARARQFTWERYFQRIAQGLGFVGATET